MKKLLLSLAALVGLSTFAHAEGTTLVMESFYGMTSTGSAPASKTAGDYTVAVDQATGGNAPAYNVNGKDLRLYANNTITISTTGADMTSLKFVLSAQGKKQYATVTASVGTVATQASGDTELSWTGSAKSVTFTVGAENTYGSDTKKTSGQFDFLQIDINGGGEQPVVPPTPPAETVKVANIAAFLANPSPEGTYEFTSPVNVVYQYNYGQNYNLYVQDATGSMLVYGNTNHTYKKGDVVPAGFKGKYKDYYGTIELENVADFAAASGTAEVTPKEYAVKDLTLERGNEYVVVKGVKVAAGTDEKTFVVSQDGAEIGMYNKFGISVSEAESCDVIGVINCYQAKGADAPSPQIYPIEIVGQGGDVPVTPDRVAVANVEAFLAVEAGTEVTFTSPVNVVYQNGLNLYVEDATGGMFIYGTTNQTYEKGDVIPAGFEGKYTDYKGCIEFEIPKGVDGKFAAASGTAEVNPVEWALEDISTDIQNQYVIVKGVAVEEAADGSGLVMTQNGAELTIYDKFKINLAAGENLNVTGLVAVFSNALQFYPLVVTDDSGSVVEAVAAPKFSVAAGAVEEGTSVEITCETEGATIHYTTDGTEPTEASATYADPIVVDKDMTIKAIAVKEGLTNSVVVTADYTIKKALNIDAQIDFTNPSALNPSYDMSKAEDDGTTGNKMYAVSDVWFTNGDLRVKGSISTTNTDARLYYQPSKEAVQFRIYKGATLTVESTNTEIATVVITFNNGNTSAKQFKPELTATDDTNVYTYTVSPAAKEVTFTVGGSVQINKVGVVYAGGAGIEGVEADEAEAAVEYFNLQGVRVANPESGLYIRRQGNKVEKVVIR